MRRVELPSLVYKTSALTVELHPNKVNDFNHFPQSQALLSLHSRTPWVYYSGQLARTIRNSVVSLNQYYYFCQPTYADSTVDIAPHARLILFFNKFSIKFCIIIYLTYILYHNFFKKSK